MLKKQLTMIYNAGTCENEDLKTETFNGWKKLHMFLFENGIFEEFQIYLDGSSVLHYRHRSENYHLHFTSEVPGSVLFEIVNRHASAQL